MWPRSALLMAFLVTYWRHLSHQVGDVALSEVFVSGDATRATTNVR